jgi:hypothetical protein
VKYTLLQMTQLILSSMDSDEVNSINDNTEAQQVANLIQTAYFDIVARLDLPEHSSIYSLTSSADVTKPTLMVRPPFANSMEWIKYNSMKVTDTNPLWQPITFKPFNEFMDMQSQLLPATDTTVGTMTVVSNGSSIPIYYKNNSAPLYYTSPDDTNIVFDSYDSAVDTTLQASKTICWGTIQQTFQLVDTFVPALNDLQFQLLLNEAKSTAFAEMKQTANAKSEGEAKRLWTRLQRNKSQLNKNQDFHNLPNYGRRKSQPNWNLMRKGS